MLPGRSGLSFLDRAVIVLVINFLVFLTLWILLGSLVDIYPWIGTYIVKCMKKSLTTTVDSSWEYNINFAWAIVAIGQLVYVIPAIFFLARIRKWEWIKAIIIGGVITALLTSSCWSRVVLC